MTSIAWREICGPLCTSAPHFSIDECEWAAHRLQWLALGRDAPQSLDRSRTNHQNRADAIADGDTRARAGTDQGAEQQGAGDATDSSTDGIEESDGERPQFKRKDLADSQIGRACRRRSEEEDSHPRDGEFAG